MFANLYVRRAIVLQVPEYRDILLLYCIEPSLALPTDIRWFIYLTIPTATTITRRNRGTQKTSSSPCPCKMREVWLISKTHRVHMLLAYYVVIFGLRRAFGWGMVACTVLVAASLRRLRYVAYRMLHVSMYMCNLHASPLERSVWPHVFFLLFPLPPPSRLMDCVC